MFSTQAVNLDTSHFTFHISAVVACHKISMLILKAAQTWTVRSNFPALHSLYKTITIESLHENYYFSKSVQNSATVAILINSISKHKDQGSTSISWRDPRPKDKVHFPVGVIYW